MGSDSNTFVVPPAAFVDDVKTYCAAVVENVARVQHEPLG
jgi:hypothetical protein